MGNPMSQVMMRRATKWRKKAKKIELAAHAADMHAKLVALKAKAAEADADHWRQQAQWATLDSKTAQKHVKVAVKTEKLATAAEKHRERQAKKAEQAVNCRPKCDPKKAVPKPEQP